jgi:hypothetical protein
VKPAMVPPDTEVLPIKEARCVREVVIDPDALLLLGVGHPAT